jgi:hypothetical protein
MPRPTLRRATCLATMLQRCQRAWEARRSPERAASINSVESGGLACSPSRACRCVTYIQNTQNYRKSNGCIEGRRRAVCGSGKRPARGHRAPRGLVTECVGRFFLANPNANPQNSMRRNACIRREHWKSAAFLSSSSLARGERFLCAYPFWKRQPQSLATTATGNHSFSNISRARAIAFVNQLILPGLEAETAPRAQPRPEATLSSSKIDGGCTVAAITVACGSGRRDSFCG